MRMEIGGERMIWLRVGKIIVAIYIWWEAFKAANRQDIAHTIYFFYDGYRLKHINVLGVRGT